MAELNMGAILDLIGDELDDESSARDRLRAFLLNPNWRPDEFETWIQECLKRGSGGHVIWTRVLQDTVVAIGSHLGFEAEFGRYEHSRTDETTFDGLWRRATGEVMLIEVAASAVLVTRVDGLVESLRRCVELRGVGESAVVGLCVVSDTDALLLVEAIEGNEHRDWLRFVTVKDLIGLWRLRIDLEAMVGRLPGPGSNLLFSPPRLKRSDGDSVIVPVHTSRSPQGSGQLVVNIGSSRRIGKGIAMRLAPGGLKGVIKS